MTYTERSDASLSTLAEHLESEARLEAQAGSRVEGKWGPLWSAEERSDLQGKASMFERMDARVAQRPARREHRREPRVPDAPGARKWGGFLLVTSLIKLLISSPFQPCFYAGNSTAAPSFAALRCSACN